MLRIIIKLGVFPWPVPAFSGPWFVELSTKFPKTQLFICCACRICRAGQHVHAHDLESNGHKECWNRHAREGKLPVALVRAIGIMNSWISNFETEPRCAVQIVKKTKRRPRTVLSALHTLFSFAQMYLSQKQRSSLQGFIRECKNECTPKTVKTTTTTMSAFPDHDKKKRWKQEATD